MTYIVDTHILIWFLNGDSRLKQKHYKILVDNKNNFVFSTIILAEIKHLIQLKRINVQYEKVIEYLSELSNCVIYPVDELVIEQMPGGLNIHDAIIVATGLVYKNVLGEEIQIITADKTIIRSRILPVA